MVSILKKALKRRLNERQWEALRNTFVRAWSRLRSGDLATLATMHRTDKWNLHWYAQHYERHFGHFRKKRLKVLEIGVGGYADPHAGGSSLRMWKYYFPKSMIYSIDIYDKSALQEKRIAIFRGSQSDEAFLQNLGRDIGSLDIIIDDGSHVNRDVIRSFEILFPTVKPGGIYVVEDTQTSYWEPFGGDSVDFANPRTIMNYFKRLTDSLNYQEFDKPGYEPTYFDKNIVSIHFYHNLVFVYKGKNNEGSNAVVNNVLQRSTLDLSGVGPASPR